MVPVTNTPLPKELCPAAISVRCRRPTTTLTARGALPLRYNAKRPSKMPLL